MKVLLHCIYYPPEIGGLESHVHELARGLVEAGHEVRVVTSRSLPGLPKEEEMEGVRVHRSWFPSRSPLGWGLHAVASTPRTRRWGKWADIVHAQAFASIPPVRCAGRPFVATLHTSHFLTRAESPLWRPILRWMVRAPDHVLAASTEIAEVAMALAPGVEVEPVTNGVDTDRFRPVAPTMETPGPLIVVPRRLFPKNGVEYFVRAFPAVRARIPDAEAILIGDGPERERLEGLAKALGVAEGLHFLGRRPHDEMPGLLSSAALAVIPSLMEATSVAGLEAMACGLPVVASRVGGLPEIIDDEVGLLVPPADPEALAEGIVRLLHDPGDRGTRARERVVHAWSNARLVRRHLEIYERLVQ